MYFRPRIIPCLTIRDKGLVKTVKFSNPRYLGDPINAVRIFNNKGVDELCILDIGASGEKRGPDFSYLQEIASEAFMPLSYGGGITTLEQIEKLFFIGYEKVILNTAAVTTPAIISQAVEMAGSQSVVVSIDYKPDFFGHRSCYIRGGKEKVSMGPVELARWAETLGAGEILLTAMSKDGMMQGYDIETVKAVSEAVSIPVIACGGAKEVQDLKKVLENGKAHAAAAGSMFVYYGPMKAVLITAPTEEELIKHQIYRAQ